MWLVGYVVRSGLGRVWVVVRVFGDGRDKVRVGGGGVGIGGVR